MNKAKLLKVILINLALSFLVTYLCFAFITWNFNASSWKAELRIVMIVLTVFSTAIASSIMLENKE